jgi:hypothetical protein
LDVAKGSDLHALIDLLIAAKENRRAQGMRIVEAGKSKYYDAALGDFMSAKQCYERAGLDVEWDRTVRLVSDRHFRKTGFISGFRAGSPTT